MLYNILITSVLAALIACFLRATVFLGSLTHTTGPCVIFRENLRKNPSFAENPQTNKAYSHVYGRDVNENVHK
jgi:hypothetical protein